MVERFTPRRPNLDIREGENARKGQSPSASGSENEREKAQPDKPGPRLRWADRPRPTVTDRWWAVTDRWLAAREMCGNFSRSFLHRRLDRLRSIDGFVWRILVFVSRSESALALEKRGFGCFDLGSHHGGSSTFGAFWLSPSRLIHGFHSGAAPPCRIHHGNNSAGDRGEVRS